MHAMQPVLNDSVQPVIYHQKERPVHHPVERRPARIVRNTVIDSVSHNTVGTIERTNHPNNTVELRKQDERQIDGRRVDYTSHQTIEQTRTQDITTWSNDTSTREQPVSMMTRHQEMIVASQVQQFAITNQDLLNRNYFDTDATDPTVRERETPVTNSSMTALAGDMLQDPSATFAATIPTNNRMAIASLLSYDTQMVAPTVAHHQANFRVTKQSQDTAALRSTV